MVKIQRRISNNRNHYNGTNKKLKITVHQTGNTSRGANAEMHARFINNGSTSTWHYTVDDKQAIQHFEHNTQCWHAGDGRGNGNLNSIGVELCINSDGDYNKTVQNGAELVKYLMDTLNLGINDVVQHNHWSGKDCPKQIRSGKNGINWAKFKQMVQGASTPKPAPSKPSKPATPSKPSSGSIVDYLNSQGKDSSFSARKKLANQYGIKNYKGTAKQNIDLLNAMRSGKKEQPKATSNNVSNYKGGSIVDYLNLSGNKHLGGSSFNNRKKLAEANGIRGYTGTATQNKQLLLKLQGGSAATPTRSVNVNAIAEQIKKGIDSQGRRIPTGHEPRRKHFGLTKNEYAKVRARVNKIM